MLGLRTLQTLLIHLVFQEGNGSAASEKQVCVLFLWLEEKHYVWVLYWLVYYLTCVCYVLSSSGFCPLAFHSLSPL